MTRAQLLTASLFLVAACGGPKTTPTDPIGSHGGAGSTWAPTVVVDANAVTGWLALAPAATEGLAGWIPVSTAAAAVVPSQIVSTPPAAGATLVAVPSNGGTTTLTVAAAPAKIVYGCSKPQDSLAFTGDAALAPGVVWLTPSPAPAGWAPAAVAIELGEQAAARRELKAGALAITQTTAGGKDGETTVTADGRTLLTLPFEADLPPVDLSTMPSPGIPELVAAYSLAPDGPMLLVLRTPHEDLMDLTAYLVGADGGAEVEALAQKLYYCGF